MDKKSFLNVLNQYSRGSVAEALDVIALKHLYPYSQILHVLAAKLSKDHGFSTQQQELQSAAVYASDRNVLKAVMSNTLVEHSVPHNRTTSTTDVIRSTESVEVPSYRATENNHTNELTEEIAIDLQQLQESRRNFELLFTEISEKKISQHRDLNEINSAQNAPALIINPEKDKSGKSKKQRIIEAAKALEAARELAEKPIPSKRKENTGEALIEEIASSKKEIDPETDKQRAQIEIIDSFIKAQPSIVNTKDKPLPVPSGDLSATKSGEFGDNIVSETLVDILLKQGKKDKAIEVLKKLIWKFPQKKAYFATQIEELKK